MLGKLIVWAPTRDEAIARMQRALGELRVLGIRTNAPFHQAVMADPRFRAGDLSTAYLDQPPELPDRPDAEAAAAIAAAILAHRARQRAALAPADATASNGAARRGDGWRLAGRLQGLRRV